MNPVAKIQEELADRLRADDFFSDITVLTERSGQIQNKIDIALKVVTSQDGKIGIAVVVGGFDADVDGADAPGPHFSNSTTDISIIENVTFNEGEQGTKKPAVDVALRVAQVLHHYRPEGIGQTVFMTGKDVIEHLGEVRPGEIGYSVEIFIPLDNDILDKVLAPVITPDAGAVPLQITIVTPTAGADIFHTIDDSYPSAKNTNATLYSSPFTLATKGRLRAVAHLTGSVASDAASKTYI